MQTEMAKGVDPDQTAPLHQNGIFDYNINSILIIFLPG